jgi:hypothetical protein
VTGATGATGAEAAGANAAVFFSQDVLSGEAHPAKRTAASTVGKRRGGERMKEVVWFMLLFCFAS